MGAINYDLVAERYAKFAAHFLWQDSSGTPVDLTGLAAKMQVRPRLGSDDVLLTLDDLVKLGGKAGTIDIEATAAQTAVWDFRKGVYDLVIGEERFAEGDFRVKDGATHA